MSELLSALDTAVAVLRQRAGAAPDVAIVLGSGLGDFADTLGDAIVLPYAAIPEWPSSSVIGHAGKLVIGTHASGARVAALAGRAHLYEGHHVSRAVFGVRAMVRWGVSRVVLTNAAGGIRAGLSVGEPVLISDHLNLTGRSPLAGPPPPGSRFTDLTDLYSPRLRALAREADPSLTEGVYAMMPGPHYETPAEITMLGRLGADLVGMSTVLEAIAARHLGAEVLGISLVTNLAAGLAGQSLSHAEVVEAGRASASRMGSLLAGILPRV